LPHQSLHRHPISLYFHPLNPKDIHPPVSIPYRPSIPLHSTPTTTAIYVMLEKEIIKSQEEMEGKTVES